MQQVQGNNTLFEVIVLAGGMRPGVGSKVNITRERFLGPPDSTFIRRG